MKTSTERLRLLEQLLCLASELCHAVDAEGEDIGGNRGSLTILKDIGPLVDQIKKETEMPCRTDETPAEIEAGYYAHFEHNSQLAQDMCAVMHTMEEKHPYSFQKLPKSARDWYAAHKRRDSAKSKRELEQIRQRKLRRSAISKLSSEEVNALGLEADDDDE